MTKVESKSYTEPITVTDQYGATFICLNYYEANAIQKLLENLAKEIKPGYDTGDWFHDLPPKIKKWKQENSL